MISIIVAFDRNRLIGRENSLPWRIPEDLRYFRRVTLGKPIVMGRITHESIGKALDGRRNVVVSARPNYQAPGCEVANSLEAAMQLCQSDSEMMVIGGARLYESALPLAERLYLTRIDACFEGDRHFPEVDWQAWAERDCVHGRDCAQSIDYDFVTLDRIKPLV